MLDPSDVKAAIGEHLDKMETTVNWVVGVGFLAFISGVSGSPSASDVAIPLLSTAVSRHSAFVVLGIAFLYATAALLIHFSRLSDLLIKFSRSDPDSVRILGVFQLHSWYLNPFASFGDDERATLRDWIGYPAMIVAWWLGFATLASFATLTSQDVRDYALLFVGGLVVFLASGGAANFVMFQALAEFDRLRDALSGPAERYSRQRRLRSTLIGNVLGLAFAAGMVMWGNEFEWANW